MDWRSEVDGAEEGGDMDREEGFVEGGVSGEEGVSDRDLLLLSLTGSADSERSLCWFSLGYKIRGRSQHH